MRLLKPNWPAPVNVVAYSTTREGGVSQAQYSSLNLGLHVNDNAEHVLTNRALLQSELGLANEPLWLEQVHSTDVIKASLSTAVVPVADGSWTDIPELACVVMTADCLPVLITDQQGSFVAAVHAGWRGLCNGILKQAIMQAPANNQDILVWLGPAIGPMAFQVGSEVRDAFIQQSDDFASAFTTDKEGKWKADLYQLARLALAELGVSHVYGGDHCTFSETNTFFSYRKEGVTGRMASLIYLTK
ncbi:peptidoglycan editing factor PgeF [Motilimonas cestriensis]|uniref:Purine nucleoside phosphorylase n=1 Tax=Motilimonas cestriensis TaxID=2742685 RepID=A0ABS8WH17_9GAMM|nr:peptidoglycan editing factor PgeF [Motilimonas cestriensis]MCE2597018.1 peptidoglycan editing factor PgeF [Motilimonas cestriensis]